MEQQSQEQFVVIETKVQTIYYEDSMGNITKFHAFQDGRLSLKQAEEHLLENGKTVNVVLRVLTERVDLKIHRTDLDSMIVHSEKFYNKK